ncbi:hypothetical protein [Alteribacter populi]|uniref:hypothetical protein n=1 Tax=Alteribacter populi TaxID=2011011 RepID=UPI000BBA96AC|nr:hypothetical protein [Alteribacter populi]
MEKAVEKLFSPYVQEEGAARFQLTNLTRLGSFENYVFEGVKIDTPYILRYTHSNHRSIAEIESELDWIHFLKIQGANVCSAHPSRS